MKGTIKIEINQETLNAAVQMYLTQVSFKETQKATVTNVEKAEAHRNSYMDSNSYMVTLETE